MEISPSQWERVKELYESALRRGAPEREAFLQSESDERVRSEVARLLKEQEKLGSFLSTPPFAERGVSKEPERERIPPGEMLAGRFRILGFIAAGGMGEVYKAEDTRLDRTVALKFLPKELAEDRSALERLRREAKAASALNHPNICTVYDFGEDTGRAFIAMEYLEGETLSMRIKRGLLQVEDVLTIGVAVAGALSTAHRRGIIHRDLKPGNVMLTDTGVKLLDFGLAKSAPVAASDETVTLLTGEPRVAGTLPYMSPEQLHGGEVDARCDIFAFGAVLYEMLTGKRAFERRSSSETILAVDREEPPPVRELVKEVPEDLEKVVGRCLYDKTPLHAVVEAVQETSDWKEEKITFDAAYGNERVIAYLFLPKNASPPFQTALHFTGAAAFYERSSANLDQGYLEDFDFVVKSGRAVMFPVYKGMFERWDDFKRLPKDTLVYREHLIDWSKDLGRSIDYLETRPDIDCGKLAFQGTSFGAAIGAILPAIEDRLRVLVLESPGFTLYKQLPEGDQLNFAPRVKAPVLLLNGRFDYMYPLRSSQETLFRLLGTPDKDKRRVVYDTGHDIPRPEMIKETLNWLDRYLGPVK
jgi:serine/threonine protein kinase